MCLSFGRVLSLHRCLSTPPGSNDSQAPAFPGDATKVHGPGHGFLQGLADPSPLIARVSGVIFSPRGLMKPKIPSTILFEEYGHLQTGRQATEWRLFSRKGDLSWWMKGIFSSRGSWFPCNQMATGSRPNFASWPCSSVMITTDWTRSLATVWILNTPEWFLKIIRLVQHPGQHLTTELVEKWEAEINSFKSQASVKSTLQEWDTKLIKLAREGDAGAHLTYKEIEICTKSEVRTQSWFYKRAFCQ